MAYRIAVILVVLVAVTTHALEVASAEDCLHRHALWLVAPPKYGADFKNFNWVYPQAPTGGVIRLFQFGTFDSLNPFADKGVKAEGLFELYDRLLVSSADEPGTEYGLIAEWVCHPDDFSSATFHLRDAARFHDGTPMAPEDVIFSFDALKKSSSFYSLYYRNVLRAEKTGSREVTFFFDTLGNRELPQIVGQLPVLPKHYWTAGRVNGDPRDVGMTTFEIPLGSGPYRISAVSAGRSISYQRVTDYWAKDLPVRVGQYNFDELHFSYFRDYVTGFEAFKTGLLDIWFEVNAAQWSSSYTFRAVENGLVIKEAIPFKRVAPLKGFAFNARRRQFSDVRVRRAFNLVFNFERINKDYFHQLYQRVGSYFDNSELAAVRLPEGRELELLQSVRADVPPEVFSSEFKNSVNNGNSDERTHLLEALSLLSEAGWSPKDGLLKNASSEVMDVEFLLLDQDMERVTSAFAQQLKRIGIRASIRVVDPAQFQQRKITRDFDIIVETFAQSPAPGNEQREFWSSSSAGIEGSRNVVGIRNPAVDYLVEQVVFAKDRAALIAASRALDRVLLWNFYVVPLWKFPFELVAWWDVFGRPENRPEQTAAVLRTWWIDSEKSARVAAYRGHK